MNRYQIFMSFIFLTITVLACQAPVSEDQNSQQDTTTMHAPDLPDTKGIINVGVVVSDLEASLAFYTEVIGMVKTRQFSVDGDFGRRSGLTDSIPIDVQAVKLKDSPYATEWKLMQFPEVADHQTPDYIHDDLGVQYITIMVDHLQPYIDRINEKGIPFLGETPVPLRDDLHFVLIQDPDGTFVELIGPM